jgi:hypothetical protein
VEDYQRQFQVLLARTHDLKPIQEVDLFTAGLIDELRIDIELQQPGNLGVAMNMARAYERKLKGLQGILTTQDNMSTSVEPSVMVLQTQTRKAQQKEEDK